MNNEISSFDRITRVYFIGIGGIGMSALARLFLYEEKSVSGSDREASLIIKDLEKEGVIIFNTQTKKKYYF